MTHKIHLRTNDHPSVTGAEYAWRIAFQLDNGDVLLLEMGEQTYNLLTSELLEQAINAWHDDRQAKEIRIPNNERK